MTLSDPVQRPEVSVIMSTFNRAERVGEGLDPGVRVS